MRAINNPTSDARQGLRQQLAEMPFDSGLKRRLIEAVDFGTEEEVNRVHQQLKDWEASASALLAELRTARTGLEHEPSKSSLDEA